MSHDPEDFSSSPYADGLESNPADEGIAASTIDTDTSAPHPEMTRIPLTFEEAMEPAASPATYSFVTGDVPQQVTIGNGSETIAVESSPEMEQMARGWLHDAGASQFEAQELTATYLGEMRHGFTEERREANRSTALNMIGKQHGARSEEAIMAAQRVVREMEQRRPGMVEFLETTGLGNHPHIVSQFIRRAKSLGYFK